VHLRASALVSLSVCVVCHPEGGRVTCVCVVAGEAGRGAGWGGVVAGRRYDEKEGVDVKVQITMASSLTFTSHTNESCHI